MNEALVIESVSVARSGAAVVREVSLTVAPGTVTTLVGPNGAGKTSLLESVSGIVRARTGTISIGDQRLTDASRRARYRAGISHVEQGRTVFPGLTVSENIRITARTEARARAAAAVFPELDKRWSSPAGLLSGGEQQMVVLARALASAPRFLLIDEMSLGLAPVVFGRLLPMVRDVAAQGVGVLLVEQFAHAALGVADQALVLAGGRVTYSGPASRLSGDDALLAGAYLGE